MKKDVSNREDIDSVINAFYAKVQQDEIISSYFSEVISVDWSIHLNKMAGFWENVLFFTGDYEGNPLDTHRHIHQKRPTNSQHFDRWKELFYETLDELFEGENVSKMKEHTDAIAAVMLQRI